MTTLYIDSPAGFSMKVDPTHRASSEGNILTVGDKQWEVLQRWSDEIKELSLQKSGGLLHVKFK